MSHPTFHADEWDAASAGEDAALELPPERLRLFGPVCRRCGMPTSPHHHGLCPECLFELEPQPGHHPDCPESAGWHPCQCAALAIRDMS
jgi:predicted amidophosphoribosyltransferase